MSRVPKNLPAPGDRVRLKGRAMIGDVVAIWEPCKEWPKPYRTIVAWDWDLVNGCGPLICHLFELEKVA